MIDQCNDNAASAFTESSSSPWKFIRLNNGTRSNSDSFRYISNNGAVDRPLFTSSSLIMHSRWAPQPGNMRSPHAVASLATPTRGVPTHPPITDALLK